MAVSNFCQVQITNIGDGVDSYSDTIDMYNACRTFYLHRQRRAEEFKQKFETNNSLSLQSEKIIDNSKNHIAGIRKKKQSSIENAMGKLRTEMASLMDQDVALMRQLLQLNETIEEIKWQRKICSKGSLSVSQSCDLSDLSCLSLDDADDFSDFEPTENLQNQTELRENDTTKTYFRKDSGIESGEECPNDDFSVSSKYGHKYVETGLLTKDGCVLKISHGEQKSYDSGIHEPDCEELNA